MTTSRWRDNLADWRLQALVTAVLPALVGGLAARRSWLYLRGVHLLPAANPLEVARAFAWATRPLPLALAVTAVLLLLLASTGLRRPRQPASGLQLLAAGAAPLLGSNPAFLLWLVGNRVASVLYGEAGGGPAGREAPLWLLALGASVSGFAIAALCLALGIISFVVGGRPPATRPASRALGLVQLLGAVLLSLLAVALFQRNREFLLLVQALEP